MDLSALARKEVIDRIMQIEGDNAANPQSYYRYLGRRTDMALRDRLDDLIRDSAKNHYPLSLEEAVGRTFKVSR